MVVSLNSRLERNKEEEEGFEARTLRRQRDGRTCPGPGGRCGGAPTVSASRADPPSARAHGVPTVQLLQTSAPTVHLFTGKYTFRPYTSSIVCLPSVCMHESVSTVCLLYSGGHFEVVRIVLGFADSIGMFQRATRTWNRTACSEGVTVV